MTPLEAVICCAVIVVVGCLFVWWESHDLERRVHERFQAHMRSELGDDSDEGMS